jgi:hypothetical protein
MTCVFHGRVTLINAAKNIILSRVTQVRLPCVMIVIARVQASRCYKRQDRHNNNAQSSPPYAVSSPEIRDKIFLASLRAFQYHGHRLQFASFPSRRAGSPRCLPVYADVTATAAHRIIQTSRYTSAGWLPQLQKSEYALFITRSLRTHLQKHFLLLRHRTIRTDRTTITRTILTLAIRRIYQLPHINQITRLAPHHSSSRNNR